jgi:CO/xanthine dehydrogenase Mo-binding subunit
VVPVFAAVANAVANATGVWLREVPFTPQRVLQALHQQGKRAR